MHIIKVCIGLTIQMSQRQSTVKLYQIRTLILQYELHGEQSHIHLHPGNMHLS